MHEETGSTIVQLAGAMVGLVLAVMMVGTWVNYAQAEPALPRVDPSAYTLAVATAPEVEQLIAEALASTPQPVPCRPTFLVEQQDDEFSGWASSECVVQLDLDNFDSPEDFEWYAPFVVRHEVAHLATMAYNDGDPHGTLFRTTFAHMLGPLDVVEVYGDPAADYPTEVHRRGRCVSGCES